MRPAKEYVSVAKSGRRGGREEGGECKRKWWHKAWNEVTYAINGLVASSFKVSNVTQGKLEFVRKENFTHFS